MQLGGDLSMYQSNPDLLDSSYANNGRGFAAAYRPYGDEEMDLNDSDGLSDSTKASKNYGFPYGIDSTQQKQMASVGIGVASLVCESVLSHPCIVLRRQCQIRGDSARYHLGPFSLIPVFYNITRTQGFGASWKGLGSVFIVRGISLFSETAISEISPLPKDVTTHSSLKKHAQHILLKSLSWAIATPFYAASLVETVQSEVASERPGVFDCLKEGLARLLVTSAPVSRLQPLWRILPPTVLLGVGHYVLRGVVQATTHQILLGEERDLLPAEKEAEPDELYEQFYAELVAAFVGSLVADVFWFPLETLVHRLAVQGTRTLVDNTDTGLEVAPVMSAYEGFFDALASVLRQESLAGLYKGFGALLLQYGLHLLLLRTTKLAFEQLLLNGHSVRRRGGLPDTSA